MKSLVVFYSRTGTTKKVAIEIAHKLGAELEEIIDLKDRKGAIGWLSGGKDAFKKNPTEIKKIEKNPKDYDLVVVGTPVWASTMAPAIRVYLSTAKIKKAAFFVTMGGRGDEKTYADMHELIVDAHLIGKLALRTAEVKAGAGEKIDKFVEKIISS